MYRFPLQNVPQLVIFLRNTPSIRSLVLANCFQHTIFHAVYSQRTLSYRNMSSTVRFLPTKHHTNVDFALLTYLLTYLLSYVMDMLFTHVHRIGMYVIVYIAELLSLSLCP